MNKDVFERLLAILPDSPKKRELMAKYKQLEAKSKKRGGSGLQDTFEFKPVGHIKIEAINDNGEVIGTLADQKNLVVDGSEEILLRAFSGDPNRILYKNRVPKVSPTSKILIDKEKLMNQPITDGTKLLHDPNVLWSEVNDDDFEISYAYYPEIVYVKEEAVAEHGKTSFVISKTQEPGFVPMPAEIYSTYTNMFIGIGDGVNYKVDFTDPRLTLSDGLEVVDGKISTTTEGHEISFKEKISNFALDYEVSNSGAQIDIFINGVLKHTIETLDSELEEPEVRHFEFTDLNGEIETEVRIVHSGSDSGVENPAMTLHGLYFDALHKDMNHLIHEFKNFELVFDTPTAYNTSAMAPYTIRLPHKPIKPGSVKVIYNETEFVEVESEDLLNDVSFMVDEVHGILTFNRALSGVLVTYEVTGEIYDSELKNGPRMTAGTITEEKEEQLKVVNEVPAGVIDGVNKTFTVSNNNLVDGTVVVKLNGTALDASEIAYINLETGQITLASAPAVEDTIAVDYEHKVMTTVNKPSLQYEAEFEVKPGTVKLIDQDGNELEEANNESEFGDGKFMFDKVNKKMIHISANKADGSSLDRIEIIYRSDERPGIPTNYKRALIEKPKTINEYPWFELDKGSVRFVAEFPKFVPASNVTIREMGLFDGPRVEDGVPGFRNYPVKAFSLVRLGDTVKDVNTGIRITWTITLVNNEGIPFKGGNN